MYFKYFRANKINSNKVIAKKKSNKRKIKHKNSK